MRVLLDTNIVLDYLGANQGFTDDAEKYLTWHQKGRITNQVTHGHCQVSFVVFQECIPNVL